MSQASDASQVAQRIAAEIGSLARADTPHIRSIRRKCSRELRRAPAEFVLELARQLQREYGHRWVAYELIRNHGAALSAIGAAELAEFGHGIDSWGAVDVFAGYLAGPAWLRGQISDERVHAWTRSDDRWWRRAALVCTVALNRKARGGTGDVPRTLDICRQLAADRDDMVVKAVSWALRELVVHDRRAVRRFLAAHDAEGPGDLAGLARRCKCPACLSRLRSQLSFHPRWI